MTTADDRIMDHSRAQHRVAPESARVPHDSRGSTLKAAAGSRRRLVRRGLSMPELLVSLAIASLVLTGVATAFVASSRAVEHNDQFYRAAQSARIAVNQVMTEARRCQSGVVDDPSLELTLFSGEKRRYDYDATARTLTVTMLSVDPPVTATMIRNVASATFATDGKTISMNVLVQVGDNAVLLNGSALPRRTITYE